jgi:hypothetical protein
MDGMWASFMDGAKKGDCRKVLYMSMRQVRYIALKSTGYDADNP